MNGEGKRVLLRGILRRYGTLLALFLFCVVMSFLSPYFLNVRNLLNVLRQSTVVTLIGIGLTFPMVCKKFDISIGAVAGLGAVLTAFFTVNGLGILPTVLSVLAIGALIGCISGIAVAYLKINDFVATIAVMLLASGLDLLTNRGGSIRVPSSLGSSLRALGTGNLAGIPNASVLLLAVIAVCFVLTERTWIGRQMYSVGGNERASYLSGVRVRRVMVFSYAMSSLLASLGGFMLICRTMGAEPLGGMPLLTLGIAAMFIGQTVIRVGQANVLGTFVGGLFVAVMGNGFVLLNVPFYYEYILWGVVVIGAMAFSGGHESR